MPKQSRQKFHVRFCLITSQNIRTAIVELKLPRIIRILFRQKNIKEGIDLSLIVMTQEQRNGMTTERNKRIIPFARNRTFCLPSGRTITILQRVLSVRLKTNGEHFRCDTNHIVLQTKARQGILQNCDIAVISFINQIQEQQPGISNYFQQHLIPLRRQMRGS